MRIMPHRTPVVDNDLTFAQSLDVGLSDADRARLVLDAVIAAPDNTAGQAAADLKHLLAEAGVL